MSNATITAYAIPTDYRVKTGFPLDHVFVGSTRPDNWNCYGRGIEHIPESRAIASGVGSTEWIAGAVGADPALPTGCRQFVDGVCQTVGNRIMCLLGQNTLEAKGSIVVLLAYGEYGFGVADYAERVRASARAVNAASPGAIPPSDVDAAVQRLTHGTDDEVEVLLRQYDARLHGHAALASAQQREQLKAAYQTYHQARLDLYARQHPDHEDASFQDRFFQQLTPHLMTLFKSAFTILGDARGLALLGGSPEQALAALQGIHD